MEEKGKASAQSQANASSHTGNFINKPNYPSQGVSTSYKYNTTALPDWTFHSSGRLAFALFGVLVTKLVICIVCWCYYFLLKLILFNVLNVVDVIIISPASEL